MSREFIGAIIFDYSDLERSVPRSLRFEGLYLTKSCAMCY